jgi:hypothetical protein
MIYGKTLWHLLIHVAQLYLVGLGLIVVYFHCFENGGIKNCVVYLVSLFNLRYLGWISEDSTSHLSVVTIYLVSEGCLILSFFFSPISLYLINV